MNLEKIDTITVDCLYGGEIINMHGERVWTVADTPNGDMNRVEIPSARKTLEDCIAYFIKVMPSKKERERKMEDYRKVLEELNKKG